MTPITILIAEDHTVVREGLRKLLMEETDFRIIGEAATGRKAVELVRKLCPAVVVMDIAMPALNGLEATRQICETNPKTRVLILSAHSDDVYRSYVSKVGAAGYLVKQTSSSILANAIRDVARGKTFFAPPIAARFQKKPAQSKRKTPKDDEPRLSSRETEVLQLIAEGGINKQIADELKISIKTVEKHRQSIRDKLGIQGTAGLTRYAIATGVIESSVQLTII